MCDKAGAGGVIGVVEVALALAAVPLPSRMLLIAGVKKAPQVVIEPPGMRGDALYLKSTMAFSSPVKSDLLKEGARPMHQAMKIVVASADAFAVKARKERSEQAPSKHRS